MPIEMGANFSEASGDLRGLRDAESRESLVETEIRSWHDREVDYTERHPPRRAALGMTERREPKQKASPLKGQLQRLGAALRCRVTPSSPWLAAERRLWPFPRVA